MKKYIFMSIMSFLAFTASAQKLEKPTIDKITGDTTLETKEQPLQSRLSLSTHLIACSIIKARGLYLLYFHIKEGGEWHIKIDTTDKAIIKFTDGKVLVLNAPLEEHSSINYDATPVFTDADFPYLLSSIDIDQLRNGKISIIRLNTSKGNFDYDISDGKSEIIKKQLELITK